MGVEPDDALLATAGVSPRFSSHLASFPPTFMTVGTVDPLLQQSLDFDGALLAAGVESELLVFEGATHAFLQIEAVPAAGQGLEAMAAFLGRHLGV